MILSKTQDKLNFTVCDNRDEMGASAARKASKIIVDLQSKQEFVRIIFASAPSQNEFLRELKTHKEINWSQIIAFHMDEYIGLKDGAPQAFSHYIKENLLEEMKPKVANFIDAQASDSNIECARYSALLEEAPIDLVCLGVGENGHIAFNDPWVAKFNDKEIVKKVQLDDQCRQQQVNDGCFETFGDVPEFALTLTIPTLFNAKHMVCIVPGPTKTAAVTEMINGDISEDLPASILRKHESAYLYLDAESGANLK